ncbi:MAG TPA: hypothetical protein VK395_06450 [Gemmataceae bacterium]|nr:hypothetical protein [Gemmataceae bacterium]
MPMAMPLVLRSVACSSLVLLLHLSLAHAEEKIPARELRAKLAKPVSLERGIPADTPLKDALALLAKQFGLTFWVDQKAFREDVSIDNIEEQLVRLPKSSSVRLEVLLQLLLKQVNGAYRVHDGHIEVTTLHQLGILPDESGSDPSWLPLVNIAFEKRPLHNALKELATATGINILLDEAHAGDKANTPVSATLEYVQLGTAVRLLADQADLKAVLLENVLYVSTVAKADALQRDQERRVRLRMQINRLSDVEHAPVAVSGPGMGIRDAPPAPRGPITVPPKPGWEKGSSQPKSKE